MALAFPNADALIYKSYPIYTHLKKSKSLKIRKSVTNYANCTIVFHYIHDSLIITSHVYHSLQSYVWRLHDKVLPQWFLAHPCKPTGALYLMLLLHVCSTIVYCCGCPCLLVMMLLCLYQHQYSYQLSLCFVGLLHHGLLPCTSPSRLFLKPWANCISFNKSGKELSCQAFSNYCMQLDLSNLEYEIFVEVYILASLHVG